MSEYSYATSTGYSRARADWANGVLGGTPILESHLDRWDQAIKDIKGTVVNVRDYGAVGDGSTDDATAIANAYTALPAAGGTIYFPPSSSAYRIASALTFSESKPLALRGAGTVASRIAPAFAAGNAISVSGSGHRFSISDLTIAPTVTRNQNTYNLYVNDVDRTIISDIVIDSPKGGLISLEGIAMLTMTNVSGDSNAVGACDICLRIKACGGLISNCLFRQAPDATSGLGRGPCVHLTGTSTSLGIVNCNFVGGGPLSSFTASGSVGVDSLIFTVASHNFAAGDLVAVRGMTPAAYNNVYRVQSVTATTVVVPSVLNPGDTTVSGTIESLSACVLVSNEDGPCNESRISDTLFEGFGAYPDGAVGLYFDGRRGTFGGSHSISGWNVSGNYYDFGSTGILISGEPANTSFEPTVFGIAVTGGSFISKTRSIHIDQAHGIGISDALAGPPQTPVNDAISDNAAVYIYAGTAAPYTQGITITGSQLGTPRNWQAANNVGNKYGVLLDRPGIQDLSIDDATRIFGSTAAIGDVNSPKDASQRWSLNAQLASGSLPIANSTVLPSVASANSLALEYHVTQKVTGTTNIQTITTGWVGREVRLLFVGALSLVTGGNLALAANYSVPAGQMVTLIHDGTNWYVK